MEIIETPAALHTKILTNIQGWPHRTLPTHPYKMIKSQCNIQGWTRSLQPESLVHDTASRYWKNYYCGNVFQQNDVCPSPAPSPPGRVVAVSGGRGDLLVGWTPPKQPNGRLLQYTVTTRTKSKRTGGSTGDLSFAKRTQPMGDGHLPQLN